jgi:hypothetical protein
MSDLEDEGSDHSIPSIGDDVSDLQAWHLVISEDRCRALYKSSDGRVYICPQETAVCHKRNHIRIRVTNRGTTGIHKIHRGVRGAFRGIYGDRKLTPGDHNRLLEESRGRDRASISLNAGLGLLTGVPPPPIPPGGPPVNSGTPPVTAAQITNQLLATIVLLQAQLASQHATAPVTPAATHGGSHSPCYLGTKVPSMRRCHSVFLCERGNS